MLGRCRGPSFRRGGGEWRRLWSRPMAAVVWSKCGSLVDRRCYHHRFNPKVENWYDQQIPKSAQSLERHKWILIGWILPGLCIRKGPSQELVELNHVLGTRELCPHFSNLPSSVDTTYLGSTPPLISYYIDRTTIEIVLDSTCGPIDNL